MLAKPVHISDSDFESVIAKNTLVVVDFWAQWCGPCHTIAPVLEQLAQEYDGKVLFAKLNVDENPITTQNFSIMSIPSLMVFKDGKPVEQLVGAYPKTNIVAAFSPYL